ncbi:MAG: mechanosensitive ion channel family protein [Limnohabitans sp.]|jgi:small-conductance mechanosensitive channel
MAGVSPNSKLMADPLAWLDALAGQASLLVLAVFAGCIALSWLLTWGARRLLGPTEMRILLGQKLYDGVLFPILLLGLTFAAQTVLARQQTLALFDILLPVCLSLAAIRLGVKVLQVTLSGAAFVRTLERSLSWVAWLGVVLWVTGILPMLLHELDQIRWKIGSSHLSVRNLIEGGLTAGVVLILTLWVSAALESRLLHSATGSDLSLRKVVSNGLRALLMFIGVLMALSAVGIDLTALSVLGGAIGVGIGFGLQKLAANYVSGFVILAERSVRIGDLVKVDGFEGRITDIKARYTVIRSPQGRESIVPNEMMITARIENMTLADTRMAQSIVVHVVPDSDVDRVTALLLQACKDRPRVLAEPAPSVVLTAVGADGLEFTLGYWIEDPENGLLNLKSEIHRAVLDAFRAHAVSFQPSQAAPVAAARPASP